MQSSGGKIGFELCVNLVHNYWNRLKTIFTQNYYPTEFLRQWFARGSNTCYPRYFTIYFFLAKQLNFFDCFIAKYLSIYQINKHVKLYAVPFSTSSQFRNRHGVTYFLPHLYMGLQNQIKTLQELKASHDITIFS